ncbi:MAG: tRNA (adenosine(37)-N6)-threonylcarbamoyltransferase complex ATPase subunit type 1 TsaE [Chitinophagaceae bacterium]
MELVFSLDTISKIATGFWKSAGEAKVIAFHGEMGAGKTTFIHALCDIKQVKEVVGSPTFSIINEYTFIEDGKEKKIYHIDLYRLKNEQEAVQAGIEDCLYSDHTCLVEWPEKAAALIPPDALHVHISLAGAENRKLIISRN